MTDRARYMTVVVWTLGFGATTVGMLLGVLVLACWPDPRPSGWWAMAAIGGVALAFTFVATVVAEPSVSRLSRDLAPSP
jgi:hypothetical protein